MLFVGIDIGKNNHVASMLDENGKVVFKAFSFPNTTNGGNALLSKRPFQVLCKPKKLI